YRMTTRVNSSTSSVWVPPVTEVRQVEVKPGYWVQTTIWVKLSDGYWTTVCRDVWREGRLEWGFYIDEWDYLVLYQYWVPGYYERVCETYWVPPVWVEMEHWYYVPPVYETRVVEIVPGYWLYYTDYWIETDRDTDTHLDKRHGLGLGWQWEFPTLELRDGNITFHSSGQSLTVDWNTASRFKDYPLLDLCFDNDSSTFNNGQVASRYKVVAKDGRITYFGSDGRLLGIVDRYGNRITFQHTTLNGAPVISQITDAIGRVITFTYSQSQVRVTAPDGRVWQYNLTVSTAANKPVLSSMVDPLGRTTTYSYNLADGNFSFTSKYSLNVTNTFANLVAMTYPTGGSSSYTYIKTKDNLGNDGARELYKIASRQDSFDSTIRNRATFTHSGEAWWVPDLLEPI
ncbi:MAG: hypothetical protein Q8S19_09790, partial [Bacillota bacterium]|nr:hypothetical protein [Bacillota bacterium]